MDSREGARDVLVACVRREMEMQEGGELRGAYHSNWRV